MTGSTPRVRVRIPSLTSAASPTPPLSPETLLPNLENFRWVSIDDLKPTKDRIRAHKKEDQPTLIALHERFKICIPLLVTRENEIIDGHLRFETYQKLGLKSVLVQSVDHLSSFEVKALRISLHAFAERAKFIDLALSADVKEIFAHDPLLSTYMALPAARVDALLSMGAAAVPESEGGLGSQPIVSVLGDRWVCAGGSVIYCGDAKEPASYTEALAGLRPRMVLCDSPYGLVPIKGVVSKRHEEFVEGSSMTREESSRFFGGFLGPMHAILEDGALAALFIDHRAIDLLMIECEKVGLKHLTTCVWDKQTAGMGGIYRVQHENILIMKKGTKRHTNNVQLGKYGRNRTTVWSVPGLNQFGRERHKLLKSHPTVKPRALLTGAIIDMSNPGDVVLDPFLGSGSTLVAAHITKRIGVGIELFPPFVDVAVRRMQEATGEAVRNSDSGLTFAEVALLRHGGCSAPAQIAA